MIDKVPKGKKARGLGFMKDILLGWGYFWGGRGRDTKLDILGGYLDLVRWKRGYVLRDEIMTVDTDMIDGYRMKLSLYI